MAWPPRSRAARRNGNSSFRAGASNVKIEIKNKSGAVVYTETKSYSAGAQSFSWNGKDTAGLNAPEGEYTIKVTAKDGSGAQMNVKTMINRHRGRRRFLHRQPVLRVGSINVPIQNVKSISRCRKRRDGGS